jgi:hypothetical protein
MQQHEFMEEIPRYHPKLWYSFRSTILLAITDILNPLFSVPTNNIGEEARETTQTSSNCSRIVVVEVYTARDFLLC